MAIITDDLRVPRLGVGDRVEDRRPTIVNSGPDAKPVPHSTGFFGTVIKLTETGFRVLWDESSPTAAKVITEVREELGLPHKPIGAWEMGYDWSFWQLGIRRPDQF